ncbi:DUF4325 domain-containing protein [Haemophilus parainfluenzae]|jgi:hypothetical protein|nr:STAS-like domain-containing protein [Haemophilus parainfluenzae]PMC56440.1 DUF4325 domain-containing protein [Haemophilus parainfluenzae]RDE81603.1 DUF4325 domain-containing protein [Haemophilus parainfluenzae]
MQTIYVKDFSQYPGPRYIKDGKASGEEFRDTILIPAIRKDPSLILNLDGTEGYGSSFLEETFGGAIRKGIEAEVILNIVNNLVSEDDPDIIYEIKNYVEKEIGIQMSKGQ